MRVCKHGCDVKMFCFSRANHSSTNLKKFLSWKPDKFTLSPHSLVGWNLENLYKHAVSIFFFAYAEILIKKNLYFGKLFFFSQNKNHRQTIRIVRSIVMSRATCDPIHLLDFVTPALGLIQVISRNIKHKLWHLLIPNVDIMYEKWIKITYRLFLVSYFTFLRRFKSLETNK